MRIISFIVLILVSLVSHAQILKPAKWSYDVSRKEVKAGDSVELIFRATIDKDWYLYSSDFDPDLGPTVTTFTFKPDNSYELVGGIKPINPKKKYDELWEGEYTYFTGKAEFRQTVKILKPNPRIEGSYDYQVCSDVSGQCIPFEDDFTLENFGLSVKTAAAPATATAGDERASAKPAPAGPDDTAGNPAIRDTSATAAAQPDSARTVATQPAPAVRSGSGVVADDSSDSLATFMFFAFLAGLAALLTPCVFPMIPMTVTFFTRQSVNRNQAILKASIYGFSIILLYILIGTVVSVINGPAFANFISTHWLPNLIFFFIFIFFALSFLGLFEITIPGSVITKVDQQADRGGYIGVFFMALTIVLVSFSCTGPIVGSILVASAGGQIVKPVAGMFAFSLAFALPFGLFAVFPNWLSNLPKSGGWLNSVKVVLGFLELALALKFLSIADQVYHWNILDREVFLAFWIVIFALIGFYLLGKIKMPHDPDVERVSVPRVMLAIVTFTFVVYLIPGMFGAPLKALAGYLPPQTTQDFNLMQPGSGLFASQNTGEFNENPKYSDFLKLPHGLNGFFDYQEGLAYAKKVNKPVLLDFTGHGCVNCREVEARVWSDPAVLRKLANEYVIISLYVDEKHTLPESEWYTSSFDQKVKKTIGGQNADFQITRFGNNAQPYYVLVDTDGEMLVNPPMGYTSNIQAYANYLDEGIRRFTKGNNALVQIPASQ